MQGNLSAFYSQLSFFFQPLLPVFRPGAVLFFEYCVWNFGKKLAQNKRPHPIKWISILTAISLFLADLFFCKSPGFYWQDGSRPTTLSCQRALPSGLRALGAVLLSSKRR